ncbi:thioredoxin family protein [Candidatus Uhrbacteria bacterium]|nr:thioredoxin family protein [Candidatus Uhrbacteria bacterium]
MEIKIQKNLIYAVGGVLAVIVIGGVVWASRGNSPPAPYAGTPGADLPTVVGEPSLGGPKIPFTATENYKEYTPEVLSAALASGNATLLYFYANWCGTCRGQEPINEAFFNRARQDNLAVMGVRVNVDDNQPLMRQYRINYQHSYVLLDKSGNPVDRFYGDHSEEELRQKVQQVL